MTQAYNCLYAHSGGVSSALNATAAGVITMAKQSKLIHNILIPKHGLPGLLNHQLINATHLSQSQLNRLYHTPSSAFGTSRFKLPKFEENPEIYDQIHQALLAHQIRYFLYNGGGDSQDTTLKLAQYFNLINSPIQCLGLPKTIDNDLAMTEYCPGYGSCAKYVATSILEATMDIQAVYPSSTKVFILEVMGRHSGWLAAASALARSHNPDAPHMILLPERPQSFKDICNMIQLHMAKSGFCTMVVAEGFSLQEALVSDTVGVEKCPFGHQQLGGIAQRLTKMIKSTLKLKTRFANADYLQRASGHLASQVDLDIAFRIGQKAVLMLESGMSGSMITVCDQLLGHCPLEQVANTEKLLPNHFISKCAMDVTQAFINYASPYIQGNTQPPYQGGLPDYFQPSELLSLEAQETLL